MPQLDAATYLGQVFWLSVTFGGYYLLALNTLVPALARRRKVRAKKLAHGKGSAAGASQERGTVLAQCGAALAGGSGEAARLLAAAVEKGGQWREEQRQSLRAGPLEEGNGAYLEALGEVAAEQAVRARPLPFEPQLQLLQSAVPAGSLAAQEPGLEQLGGGEEYYDGETGEEYALDFGDEGYLRAFEEATAQGERLESLELELEADEEDEHFYYYYRDVPVGTYVDAEEAQREEERWVYEAEPGQWPAWEGESDYRDYYFGDEEEEEEEDWDEEWDEEDEEEWEEGEWDEEEEEGEESAEGENPGDSGAPFGGSR